MGRVIEITGVAGVGKSYIIDKLAKQNRDILLDSELVDRYRLNDIRLLIEFFKIERPLDTLRDTIRLSILLDISLFNKLNFIRNTIKKIGKSHFLRYKFGEDRVVVIDEGLSHLYQNVVSGKKQDYSMVLKLVDRILLSVEHREEIVIVDAPFETIYERLSRRGHRRVNSENIVEFIDSGKRHILELKKRFPKAIEISNWKDMEHV
ncbi:MAG: AAA family ATPase [Epsilonproteobacteria bacterium]|nr:AAA family ATPase [Campylobacterota bacterium]